MLYKIFANSGEIRVQVGAYSLEHRPWGAHQHPLQLFKNMFKAEIYQNMLRNNALFLKKAAEEYSTAGSLTHIAVI